MTSQELEQLISVAAHELRGPLHGMSLLFHVVERATLSGAKLEPDTFVRGRRLLRRLNRILEEVLELSRLWEGKMELILQEIDLIELLREVVKEIDTTRAGDLHLDLPAHPVMLHADRARLCQVLGHLLDNATQYTPPGSRIVVAIEGDDQTVALRVTDEGPGIQPDILPGLLERVRLCPSQGSGLGVGLFLVQALTCRHGGTFSLAAGPEHRGTIAQVLLPRAKPAPRPRPTTDRRGAG